jgi:hypothetical protein
MELRIPVLFSCFLVAGIGGCGWAKPAAPAPEAGGIRAEELVGKWRLVRAGGQPPSELWIKSSELEFKADGTWATKVEGEGQWLAGMTVKGGGNWSLADGEITRTNGVDTKTCRVQIEAGQLILDPDLFLTIRKKGPDVAGEYERQ